MSTPAQQTPPARPPAIPPPGRGERRKIRNRMVSVAGLLLVIAALFVFLFKYTDFHDFESADTNWTVFVAVSVTSWC